MIPALVFSLAACTDVSRFTTSHGEAFCGSAALGSAFRDGIGPRMQMRLELDADAFDGPGPAGTLWTYEPTSETAAERWFDGAGLVPFDAMRHDVLSRADLGEARERTGVFSAAPTDGVQAPMIAMVSLRSDDKVEVRLVRAGPAPGAEPRRGAGAVFGVFVLQRRTDRCGF